MANRYWVGGGSSTNWNATGNTNWSATSGGANNASVPTSADDVFFDASSGSGTAVVNGASQSVRSFDCTGYTGTLSFNTGTALVVAGVEQACILSSGMTLTMNSGSSIDFTAIGGTNTLTSNGKVIRNIEISGVSKVLKLTDNLTLTSFFTLTSGVLNRNNKSLVCSRFISDNSNRRMFHSGTAISVLQSTTTLNIAGGTASSGELGQARGQSFTAEGSVILGVAVDLLKSGTPTDDLKVSIYDTLGGNILVTKTVATANLVNDLNYIQFDTPLTVTPTTVYFLVLERTGARDVSNCWNWYTNDAADVYAGGHAQAKSNNAWTEVTGDDRAFMIIEEGSPLNLELNGTGDVWDTVTSTNFYRFDGDYEIELTNNSSSSKTIEGGGIDFYDIYNNTSGTGTVTFDGNNSYNKIKSASGRTNQFGAGTTHTINTLEVDGATIRSQVNGSTYTFSKTSGEIVITNCSLRDCIATGGADFRAILTTNVSGNTGWKFVNLPPVTTEPVTSITFATAIGNGTITDDYDVAVTRRGFVYSTTSRSLPGNVDPSSTSYESLIDASGTFVAEAFDRTLTGLTPNDVYYVRAFGENEAGFGYGNEVSFLSNKTFPNSVEIVNNNTTGASVVNTSVSPTTVSNTNTQTTTVVNQITSPTGIINLNTTTTNVTNI